MRPLPPSTTTDGADDARQPEVRRASVRTEVLSTQLRTTTSCVCAPCAPTPPTCVSAACRLHMFTGVEHILQSHHPLLAALTGLDVWPQFINEADCSSDEPGCLLITTGSGTQGNPSHQITCCTYLHSTLSVTCFDSSREVYFDDGDRAGVGAGSAQVRACAAGQRHDHRARVDRGNVLGARRLRVRRQLHLAPVKLRLTSHPSCFHDVITAAILISTQAVSLMADNLMENIIRTYDNYPVFWKKKS